MMNDDFSPPRNFPLMAGVFEGSLVLVAAGLGWLLDRNPAESLAWSPVDLAWGGLAVLPLLAMLGLCLRYPVGPLRDLVRVVDEMLVPMFRGCGVLEMAAISILAGLGEEMLFRGIIQQTTAGLAPGRLGVGIGLLVAAVLFAMAHRITTAYAVLAGLIGLYLGLIWLASGNLLVPVTTHAVYDFVVMLYLIKIRTPSTAAS